MRRIRSRHIFSIFQQICAAQMFETMPSITNISSPEPHPAKRMTACIAQKIEFSGQCTIMDIKAEGFTMDEISRHWPEACKIAAQNTRRI